MRAASQAFERMRTHVSIWKKHALTGGEGEVSLHFIEQLSSVREYCWRCCWNAGDVSLPETRFF
jgi:hypothetical protein